MTHPEPAWGEIWVTAAGDLAYVTDVRPTHCEGYIGGRPVKWLLCGTHYLADLCLQEQVGRADVPRSLGAPWFLEPPQNGTPKPARRSAV